MLSYGWLCNVLCCLRKPAVALALAFIVLAQLLFYGTASADPFPPNWGPTGASPLSAVHFSVVPWPNEPANPADCGENCGDWLPYRYFGSTVNDPRIQDPSNGGTSPQNYVNISSSCVDQAKPSVYYYLDKTHNTLLFRWRVEQIANNYATGPNPGTQITDSPWNSALWTVFFDLNGDGYRDFAAHLNGSSGDPSSSVDRLQGIWGNVPSNQSLDYVNDPNIHLLKHNPTGFVDSGTGRLLNFNNSLTPTALWPNGASERTWDYGTSRSRIVTQANVGGATCNEYFVDYQIPMGMLDASNYPDAPKIDENTPLSMLFCTANSLNNPFQKDCAYNGAWVADPSQPAPFGDYLTLGGGLIYQPIVDKVQASGCGPVNLATTVKDTLYTAGNVAATSVKAVDFYYYADTNGNGLADDGGSSWTLATSAAPSTLNTWQATWNNIPNLNGSYLIGVQAIDDGSRTAGGTVNRTFSYLTVAEVAQIAGQAPPGESWAANPAVTGAQSTALYLNTCGVPQPYISKAAGAADVSAGSSVAFTLTVHNTLSTALAVNSIQDVLPPGFTFLSFDSLSLGSPSAIPSIGASGTITWTFSSPASVPAGGTLRLVFHALASSTPGTYSNIATAMTGSGTLVSDPVQVSVGTPRLTIAKAASAETLKPGDVVTYTITYANNSPVNVTGAVITDVVPAGLSNITPLDSGVYVSASRMLTWTIGAIASGAGPYTVRFTAKVDSPYGEANPLANTANIDSLETEPASASSSTLIEYPAPQLVLQKIASPTSIDAGKEVTFTLRYQNVGSAAASSVVITDAIPTGFSFVSASNGGANSSGTVQWSIGSLGTWASGTVVLVLRADSPYTAANPQTNTAWIRAAGTAAVSASATVGINATGQLCSTYYFQKDTVSITGTLRLRAAETKPLSTTVGWAGIQVTAPKSSDPFSETLTFYQDPGVSADIDMSGNISTTFYVDRAPGVGVDLRATVYDYDPIAGRTALGTFTQRYGGGDARVMQFEVPSAGTLRRGHRLLWVFDVRATAGATSNVLLEYGGTVTNTLSAPTTTSFADSRSYFCVNWPANLMLQKQVDKQQVTLGDTVVYTLTFANTGSTGVTTARITDTLPSGVTYQSAALNGVAANPVSTIGQTVIFAVNSPLQPTGVITRSAGGSLVITGVVASSLPLATTTLLNQAALGSDQTLLVTAAASTAVVQPNLMVSKRVSQSLLAPGDPVTYTMVVQNTGTYTATNVTISDTLPATAYYTYVAGSTRVNNGVAADSVTGNLLSVNTGALGPGATATVAFSMKVAASGVPDGVTVLNNMAAVTSTQTAAKTSQAVDVFISTNPNLAISKGIEPSGSLAPGDLVTYTLAVTNTGRGDALNVEVIDPLPANAAYVFGSLAFDGSVRTDVQDADNAWFEAAHNRVRYTIGTLTQGQAHTMVFHARVAAPLPNGILPVDNLASVYASNTATKDALASSLATAAPTLTLDKQGPSVVAYPAAKVVTTAAAATTIEVDSAAQLMVGQYVSVNGLQRKITAITGHTITVAGSLSVTAGQAVVGSFTYDIAYRNTGNAAAGSVAVVDTLPAGLNLIETSPTAQVSGSRLTWDIGTLDTDEAGVLRVVVLPTASGVLTNSAVLDSSETDPITDTVVTTAGGLIVSKRTTTSSVEQTPSGTAATYVIEVQNTLATAASGVIVTDTLPPGFVYQATVGTPTGGTRLPATPAPVAGSARPAWGTFSIPANSTLAITFTASIAAEAGAATYQNAVFATSTNAAVTQFDELSTSAEDVTVLLPQVILAKTVSPSQVTAGDTVTYTITAQNVGGAPARTLQISDVLPAGFSYTGPMVVTTLAATRTATLNPSLGDVQPAWGAWDVAPGGTLTLTFAVDTTHAAGTYYNDVNAGGANFAVPSLDDTAPVTLTAAVADLRLVKVGSPATQYVGQSVVFMLALTNDGPSAASGVTVSDTLPSGFTYGDSSAADGTYDKDTGLWTVGSLSKDADTTLVITATVNAGGSYTNHAQVASSDEVDPNSTPGNNSTAEDDDDSVTITAVPVADLHLAKSGTPASQYMGQNVVFTLTLTNDGPSAASGVTVNDLLPSGFTYSASSAGQGTYNSGTGLWTVGNLGKDARTTLVLTATVNATGEHTNYAQVASSNQLDGDSTPGNSSITEDDDDSVTITVIPVADLHLAKVGTPATQHVGQNVVFTLTLTNDGPSAASGVTVSDTLPSGFSYVGSLPADGTYDKEAGLWTVGDLAKDAGTTLVITATVNADGNFTNYAQVANSDQHDGNSTPGNDSTAEDDDDSVTITVVPVADLRLEKNVTPATQYVGENVVFTLTLTNDGPSAASGVTVSDTLPSGFTYVDSLPADGTYDKNSGLWTVGSLEKDGDTTLVITASVNADGGYINYAEVAHSDQHDGDSTPDNSSITEDDDDSVTIAAVPVADLRLAKVSNPGSQYVGQNAVFTLTLTNDGPNTASSVTVSDTLPSGFSYVASLPSVGTYDDTTGLWTVGSLDKDGGASLVITATVNVSGTYTNYAQVAHSDQHDGDSTPGNSSSFEDDDDSVTTLAIPVADLHLAKNVTPATQYMGENVVFTLTLTNDGPSAASGVTVSDTLPSGFTYGDSSAADGTYNSGTGLWTVGDLSKDAGTTLVITATVNADGSYTNYAQVAGSGELDPNSTPGNNSSGEDDDDSVTLTAVPVADLHLAKSGTPATQYVDQNVVFTLTLTNDGPSAASGVSVSDTLPSGFTYVDSSAADGTYDKNTGLWTVGDLGKDGDTMLVITATVNAGGDYTNYAQVASSGEVDPNSTPGNNSTTEDDDDSVTITAVPVADLRLAKSGTPASQYVGQNVVFTLTLTNDGPSAASGVSVSDTLPSGFTYVDSSAADGTYDRDTGLWTVGSLDKDAGTTLVITATVNAAGDYSNYAQVANSGQVDPDSAPGNNSTTEDDDDSVTITAVPVADLHLEKTGAPALQQVGQGVVFTLTLTNDGPSAASGVTVSDTLPSGFTYVDSLPADGAYDKDSGLWTVGSLDKDAGTTLVITATVNVSGPYTNYAEVASSAEIDPDSTPANGSTSEDDDDSFVVTPAAVADLSLAKTGYPAVQYVGQNVVFTLTLANGGPSAAGGVVVSDVMPSGFTYAGSLPSAGSYVPGSGAWTVDSLSAGANAALVLTATVNATGTYTNYAEVAAVAQVDRDSLPGNHSTAEDDDDTFVVTPVPVVDLSLAKSGTPLAPVFGSTVVFSLTVTNAGPSSATGITVRDPLPGGYTFVASQASAGSYAGDLWTLGSLDAGAAAALQISATVNISGTYINYAEIASCGEIDIDSTPGNYSTTEDDDDSVTTVPVATATIGNYVWLDANQDGVQGAGEGGVAGVMVQLFRADNTPFGSKLTDGAGKYVFSALEPGDYYLQFTFPGGYTATFQDAQAALGDAADSDAGADGKTPVTNLSSGEIDLSWDLGLVLPAAPAAIGDIVWLDADMDGLQDAGESGVPGVVVQLFKADNTPVAAKTTDAAGRYLFSNLPSGDYYVLFTPPSGYTVSPVNVSGEIGNDAVTGGTLDSDAGADGKTPITNLAAGETDSTWDLGIYLPAQPAEVGGEVWLDSVQDGLQGAAETGVAGVTVQLYRAGNTLVAGTLTDAAGGYRFANLPPGDYYVQIVPPAGYLITTQDAAGETGSDPATGGTGDSDAGADGKMPVTSLAAGETDLTWDAGIYPPAPPASIGSYVWLDANRDGIQDAVETGVAGVAVELFSQAGALLTTERTDAGGRYRFANLLPGVYYLHFVLPAGYAISPRDVAGSDGAGDALDSDADQVTGLTVPFSVAVGEQSLHWSAGLVLPAAPASLGDRVWLDTNRDGVQDITEQGVPAVTVNLLDAAGAIVKTTVTGESGKYNFDNLPAGTYALQFIPPPGYSLTKPDVLADFADSDADPGSGQTVTFTLTSGQRNPTLDAGLYLPEPPVSIGHRVWYDSDQDGVQDVGETGVPGVPVMIYRADGTFVAAATTDNTGSYRFDRLPAGYYFIRFAPPALYAISPQDTGTDDAVDSDVDTVSGKTAAVTFSPGVTALTWDMGLYLPTQPSVFSGDTWIDINNNGIQEEGEPPVADVVVKLFDAGAQLTADGILLAQTTTGTDGRYEFDNLAAGAYYLEFIPKPGYAAALADVGIDSFDSDANAVTGRTTVYVLAVGERAESVNAGYVPLLSVGDLVFNDFRNNGTYESAEDDGVDGVKVNIYHDADGDGVLSAADGDPVASTITDNGGRYLFTGLTPGDYIVELDDSNFAEGGLIRMFASSLSSRNAAVEPIVDPDNDLDGDDNGYDSHAPDGGVDIVSRAISLAFDAEPITDGDLNPSSNLSLDFGIYDPTVGNRVWLDRDMDGVQDDGEPGIAAVVMNIYLDSNTNGVLDEHDRYLRSLTTNADGVYLFTFLAPGDYIIQVAPANFEPGGVLVGWHPAAGGSDPDDDVNTDSNGIADAYGGVSALAITLTSGGEPVDDGDTDEFTNLTVDFGFWPDPSVLGDYVWWDYNKDGIQDPGELPVAGVTVALYSAAGSPNPSEVAQPLVETTTDQQGKYLFANLVPGSYYIQFSVPPQYGITRFQAGGSRSADSDVNADGKTPVMNIAAGTADRDFDLGLIYPTAENEEPEPGSVGSLFLPLLSH